MHRLTYFLLHCVLAEAIFCYYCILSFLYIHVYSHKVLSTILVNKRR